MRWSLFSYPWVTGSNSEIQIDLYSLIAQNFDGGNFDGLSKTSKFPLIKNFVLYAYGKSQIMLVTVLLESVDLLSLSL